MAEFAAQGKTSMGWFYGFKLHLVINNQVELLGVEITAGNVDDRDSLRVDALLIWQTLW